MKFFLPSLLLVTAALSGCGPGASSSSKGGVALIDLDAAAKRLGRDVTIVDKLKEAGTPLNDQLTADQKDYQAQVDRFRESIGPKPSDADTQKLAELARKLGQDLQQKQQQAQQEMNTKRIALVNSFREEVKPVAMKIAFSKGLGIVLIKSDMVVLGSDPDLDITDEVVAELSKSNGSVTDSAPRPTP